MAASPEEARWEGRKRRLKGRRDFRRRSEGRSTAGSQDSDGRSTAGSIYSNQAGPSSRTVHRPHHGYTGRNPAHLPRLATPPAHDYLHTESDLRRSSYEQVPPVTSRHQNGTHRALNAGYHDDGEDSWGEEAESDGEEDYEEYLPRMYPYPMMAQIPYYPNPTYIFAPPPPMAYPSRRHTKKRVTYKEDPMYIEPASSHRPAQHAASKQRTQPAFDVFDPSVNPVLQQYHYPSHRDKQRQLFKEASARFLSDILFAEQLVEEFVSDTLDEEIIPDILIEEIKSGSSNKITKDHPYFWPSLDVCVNLLDEEMPKVIRGIVIEVTNELVNEYFDDKLRPGDPVVQVAEQMVAEVVSDEANTVVRWAIQEMVDTHLNKASAYDVVMDVVSDIISEMAPPVVREAVYDMTVEDFRDEEIILPLVGEMCKEVAMETVKYYQQKKRKRQENEVAVYAEGKLLDSLCLDHLSTMLGRQAQVWAREEAAGKILDIITLDILMKQYFSVSDERKATLDNKPLRNFHEKCFTDVALHVLMKELNETVDEDMADLDEYEQGLWNPAQTQPPEWALHR